MLDERSLRDDHLVTSHQALGMTSDSSPEQKFWQIGLADLELQLGASRNGLSLDFSNANVSGRRTRPSSAFQWYAGSGLLVIWRGSRHARAITFGFP